MRQICASIVFLVIWGGYSLADDPSGACQATSTLTDEEAQILLYLTPAAISARRAGTDVDIERSAPTNQYPKAQFFVAALISQKPTSASVLGNGILGYFAVDKRTGEIKSATDFSSIDGKELARVRKWLRKEHCIGKQ
jgi:hypothetical protein